MDWNSTNGIKPTPPERMIQNILIGSQAGYYCCINALCVVKRICVVIPFLLFERFVVSLKMLKFNQVAIHPPKASRIIIIEEGKVFFWIIEVIDTRGLSGFIIPHEFSPVLDIRFLN
jgi:hypothetical protein